MTKQMTKRRTNPAHRTIPEQKIEQNSFLERLSDIVGVAELSYACLNTKIDAPALIANESILFLPWTIDRRT